MNVRDRVLLPLHRSDESGPEPTFDLGSLFLHVLLFESVIVPSLALLDIAALGKSIGVGRTIDLLNSGLVRIRAAVDALGSVEHSDGRLIQLQHLRAVDPEDSFRRYVAAFSRFGLNADDAKALEAATRSQWIRPDEQDRWGIDAIADMVHEATTDTPVWRKAISLVLKDQGAALEVSPGQVRVEIVDPASQLLRFQSRLPHLNDALATKVVRRACSVVAKLNGEINLQIVIPTPAMTNQDIPLKLPPAVGQSVGTTIPGRAPVVIMGPNGAGKTRFSSTHGERR